MDLRYNEWLPRANALRGVVIAYWYCAGDASKVPSAAILPDGYVEVVFNLGDPVGLDGPAYKGDQPDRCVVGPLSSAIQIEYRGPVATFGIRFHPARGSLFFGISAPDLVNRLGPLCHYSSSLDHALSELISGTWNPESEASRAALDQILVKQLASVPPPDKSVIAVVDRLSASTSSPSVAEIAAELGLSVRQVQRRFTEAVGMPPKQFVRVTRFARLWQIATMSPPETWADLAAEHGYADQAHMIREFRSFGVKPPAHFFSADWYDSTGLTRAAGPAKGDRSQS